MDSYRITPDIYDRVYDTLLDLPGHLVLAHSEYKVDFERHVSPNNTWDYNAKGTDTGYEAILVGEIQSTLCGTCFSAKGTHYIGSAASVCAHPMASLLTY